MVLNLYLRFNILKILTGGIGAFLKVLKEVSELFTTESEDIMVLFMHKAGALMFLQKIYTMLMLMEIQEDL